VAAVIVILAVGGAALILRRETGPWVAPDFVLQDLEGKAVRLSNFRGRVVFLNVWTTWCEPCRVEMPSMEVLHRRLEDDGFVMLAVSADADGREAVVPFIEALDVSFPVLLDPDGQVVSRYGVTGYPETFIIDRGGQVVAHEIGPRDWSDRRYEQALRQLMAGGVWAPSSSVPPTGGGGTGPGRL
jgi:peroxiredoxin